MADTTDIPDSPNNPTSAGSSDLLAELKQRFSAAVGRAAVELGASLTPEQIDPAIALGKNAKLGDYQCNAALALSKVVGKPPREVAALIAKHVDLTGLALPLNETSIAGPGFINVFIDAAVLAQQLMALAPSTLGIAPPAAPATIVVDLCGVNLAKQMHVGHLRSTVIGDTIARVHERLGHKVIRQNHVGDWGLPIAMVTERVMRLAKSGQLPLESITLDDLDKAYKIAGSEAAAEQNALAICRGTRMGSKLDAEISAQVDDAKAAEARGKQVLVALQAHEPEVHRVWQIISDVTMKQCLATCAELNAIVLAEHSAGESAYATKLAPLVDDLLARGVAEIDAGAVVVRVDDSDAEMASSPPVLIRKSDGGFLYATTDLAAIAHRCQRLRADRVIYVVGAPQSLHFRQVFAAAKKAGLSVRDGKAVSLEHAAFGAILGEDNRPFKTRSGQSAKLQDLLDLAMEKARGVVDTGSPELDAAERGLIARAVATAALRYTDMSSERVRDYVFSPERMVAFTGNTGPYLLYALVRIRSIFRKLDEKFGQGERGVVARSAIILTEPSEKQLALALLRYASVVAETGRTNEPHRLCGYCYELAGAFASFFDACPVLIAPSDEMRRSRARLCELTERTLADCLTLLGIPLIDRM